MLLNGNFINDLTVIYTPLQVFFHAFVESKLCSESLLLILLCKKHEELFTCYLNVTSSMTSSQYKLFSQRF